ncbi:MAG: YidC/Oxa1 family membrane protein insertase [Firmicutes bacterium]|nr:YidC/Oxa1 family membrane protein insertase [Bacillota bacterium]
MSSLFVLLNAVVEFPERGAGWFPFIGELAYALIGAFHGGGAINYGVAIIFFSIILKLILSPLDILLKYFTKKNSRFMAKIKPEEDAIREQYAGDFMKMSQARSALFKKHGYKPGGFALFSLLNIFIVISVFMSVFLSLQAVATHNVRLMAQDLQAVYQEYRIEGAAGEEERFREGFAESLNEVYRNRNVRFLWIGNMWRQDVPWVGTILTVDEYANGVNWEETTYVNYDMLYVSEYDNKNSLRASIVREQWETIVEHLDPEFDRPWNGLLILVLLAGVSSWLTAFLMQKFQKKAKDKTPEATVKPEEKVHLSVRDARSDSARQQMPQIDPAKIGRIMLFVMPAIMVFFAMQNTAALAIYIITNSLVQSLLAFGLNRPIDKFLDWQEKRKKERGGDTEPVADTEGGTINPHAKYFKTKRGKK